jgi:hypothetical protein
MTAKEINTCGECYFAETKKKDWFFCFRYPPTQQATDVQAVTPEVHVNRRACGEFVNRSVAKTREPNARS